jgi:hypothetical protein
MAPEPTKLSCTHQRRFSSRRRFIAGVGFDTDSSSLEADVEVDIGLRAALNCDNFDWVEVAAA